MTSKKFKRAMIQSEVEKVVYVDWQANDGADLQQYRIEAVRGADGKYSTIVQEAVSITIQKAGNPVEVLTWIAAKQMPWTSRGTADGAIEQLLSLLDD